MTKLIIVMLLNLLIIEYSTSVKTGPKQDMLPLTKFRVCNNDELQQSDWLKLITRLPKPNWSALFQCCVVMLLLFITLGPGFVICYSFELFRYKAVLINTLPL